MSTSYKISGGKLTGPNGSWSLRSISGVHKTEGGKLSLKKWLITIAGLTAAGSAVTMGMAAAITIAGGSMAYYIHGTKKVTIVVDGTEVELLSILYLDPIWNVANANKECDELVALISPHIK